MRGAAKKPALWRFIVTSACRLAPRLTAKLAFWAVCIPPKRGARRVADAALVRLSLDILKRAERRYVNTDVGRVRVYRWLPTSPSRQGRVLMHHGWTSRAQHLTGFVDPLIKAGFEVVAMDAPAHGESSGIFATMPKCARAMLNVIDTVGPVDAIIAHSFGGMVTGLAMEGGPPLDRSITVDKIVLISTPDRLQDVNRGIAKRIGLTKVALQHFGAWIERYAGRPMETVSTSQFLAGAETEILLVHDRKDVFVPLADSERIAQSTQRARLLATEGYGHLRIVFAPGVITEVVAFLSNVPAEDAVPINLHQPIAALAK